ncbi:MAG: ATP-binding protein [Olsenella uli]|uniref:ATP-binding protein n=1 Tax=Olsenella uli TaxID=133926 RepID=UPI001D1B36E9|nr:ATP-binding protein [Olsenella uli]MBS6418856.1 ATP-binding protein [Olsenella uli]
MGGMDLRRLVAERGAAVPIESLWDANRMTEDEWREAAARDRETTRAFLDGETEEERALRLLARETETSGIPARFACVPPDTRFARRFRHGRGLYVWGTIGGSGKTWAACSAVRGWISDGGRGAVFAPCVAMLDDCRSAMTDGRGEGAATDRYARARLLVVDDVGKEALSPWTLAKLFEVADRRYGAMLPTVWTSQLSPARLAEHLAGRGDELTAQAVVSRIVDSCDVVEDRGADRRLEGRSRQ